MNKISVIVPIYNSEKFLEACLISLGNQVYENLEIILVDDGSTDSSFKIAKSFAEKDTRFKLFKKENGGQASARNLGLNKATGDFLSFVDSDDTVSPDFFSENLKYFIKDPELEILQVPVFFNYGSANEKLKINSGRQIITTQKIFKHLIELGDITWIVCDKIFKKTLLENLRFKEGMLYEDNYLLVDILRKSKKIYLSAQGIYFYHYRPGSTTQSAHSLKKDLDTQKVSLHIFSTLLEYPGLKMAKLKIYNRIVNVYLSQAFNYNYREFNQIPEILLRFSYSILWIVKLNSSINEKVKLIVIKIIGFKNYLLLFLKLRNLN